MPAPYRSAIAHQVENARSSPDRHAGLWFDRFVSALGSAAPPEARRDLIVETVAVNSGASPLYKRFFDDWKRTLGEYRATARTAEVQGRMVVGLGGTSLIETAITLHRTYGVPYIPGSALKGLAASYARNRLEKEQWGEHSEAYLTLFGDTEGAGHVTFFDALLEPGTGHDRRALWSDVITVHHPEYYGGSAAEATDWDSPNPVPFVTATGKYLIALGGPRAWVDAAFEILTKALAEEGIGGKTTRGYGRMNVAPAAEPLTAAQARAAARPNVDWAEKIAQMKPAMVTNSIHSDYVKKWIAMKDDPERVDEAVILGAAIIEKVKTYSKNLVAKDWFVAIQKFLAENPPT